nr:NAD(P)/FAD-dependent oxidoreductase [Lysinibacillus timonensis]
MVKEWDVVIIGGGLAGLVAANFLSQTHLSVLVLEKGKTVGGRAKTHLIDNQLFNIGPHALYKKGKAKPVLEQLGIELFGKSPKLDGLLIEKEYKYTAPFNPIGVFTTRYFNWKERIQWLKVLITILKVRTDSLSEQTFLQWAEHVSPSKAIQSTILLLGRLATYCHAPDQVSAKIVVSQLKSVMNGVVYLDGGWQTIIDQLHNKAVIQGTEVRTQQTVKQIEPLTTGQNTAFQITLANEERIYTKNILSTADPQSLLNMLGEYAPTTMKSFFQEITPVKGATLDVALTQLPDPMKLFALDLNNPLYYSVHSTYARLSNNPKNVILHVFKYLQPGEQVDSKAMKLELELFLETIQPGWKNYKITSRFIPHITVNERLPKPYDELKLQSSKSGIPGLYLAGDWASPDSILLEGAVNSAHQAAMKIIKKERDELLAN